MAKFIVAQVGQNKTTGRVWGRGAPAQLTDGTPLPTEWVQIINAAGEVVAPKLGVIECEGYVVREPCTGTKGAIPRQYFVFVK